VPHGFSFQKHTPQTTTPGTPLAPTGGVTHVGRWAVSTSKGADFAVARVRRHQLGDLSNGTVDADGCLVCS
jgi:hypothetical protein